MKMRGLKNTLFITTEHSQLISIYLVDGSPAIINFTRHVYIIEKFKTKMFIKNDIINPGMMVPNVQKSHLNIKSCKNMKINFNVKINFPIKRVARFDEVIKILTNFNSTIPFKIRNKNGLPTRRDFIIIPKKN